MKLSDLTNKTPDAVNRMTAKELSDVVAYMARQANKRVENLKKHGYKTAVYNESGEKIGTKWVNKKTSPGIDFNAIQNLNRSFGHVNQFSGMGKLRAEYIRVQGFLNAESSTVEGALKLRKKKERELFGETREMFAYKAGQKRGKKLTRSERGELMSNMDEFMSSVYENYHKWREEYAMEGGYTKERGSTSLANIARHMRNGMPAGLARYMESKRSNKEYEAKREKAIAADVSDDNITADTSPISLLDDENKDGLLY